MDIKFGKKGSFLSVKLKGEIDHHSCEYIRERIDREFIQRRLKDIELDLTDIEFMDSSAIGLIIGRIRLAKGFGGRVRIMGVNEVCAKVIRLSGLEKVTEIIYAGGEE